MKYTIYVLLISTHYFLLQTESRLQEGSRPDSICFKTVIISFLSLYLSSLRALFLLSLSPAQPPCPFRLPSCPCCQRRAPWALQFSSAASCSSGREREGRRSCSADLLSYNDHLLAPLQLYSSTACKRSGNPASSSSSLQFQPLAQTKSQ